MSEAAVDMSALATILVAALLVVGAAFTLVGSLGLIRLRTFYERVHAPTLGTTLGTFCIAAASLVHSSVTARGFAVHELLIVALVTVTTPVGLIILVRAALFRDSAGGTPSGRDCTGS